eukprot:TRINITY_DN10718_c0_g1_i1.p1 TRINITY_DN10718_c0_g1~~TRINITY_DN10718_c0_g1_i1.p1  ORF type:complete len:727 (-),score=123.09 TRINITY_DN10718_c0_g1_i1:62-1918(-)
MVNSCKPPPDFCGRATKHTADQLSYRDCDGDGILDPYCEGLELLKFGFISSKNGCTNNWPNGLCKRTSQPAPDQGEFDANKAASNEITILHFNDVYQLSGIFDKKSRVRRGGMSRAAHVINMERKRNPDRTFAVFAGDLLSPSVLSELFEGAHMVDILNTMKLDAASLGNHEFDFGVDTLAKRVNESAFPWLNINLLEPSSGKLLPGTTQRFIKDVPFSSAWDSGSKTSRVCMFGAAYDVRETMFKDKERVSYADILDASKNESKYLREHESCDVVVALTHQFSKDDCKLSKAMGTDVDLILGGHDHSTEMTTVCGHAPFMKDDCKLSKAMGTDVDLILGGHDHSTEMTTVCGHAPFMKADSDLKTQWVVTLYLGEDGKVQSTDARVLSLTDMDPFDVEIHDKIVEWEEKGEAELSNVIGCSSVDFDNIDAHSRTQETNSGDFFTDAVRSMHGTQVAVFNGGAIRGNTVFHKGDLSKKLLTAMHPFGNAVAKTFASGKELKEYIEYTLRCYETTCGDFLQISGLNYTFAPTKPKGQRLVALQHPDGKQVGDDEEFTVAITDYMLSNAPGLKDNKFYDMTTLNDAVPLVQALFQATLDAKQKPGSCVAQSVDGRIKKME